MPIQGNVAMPVAQPGSQLWNQAMQVMWPDDQNLNQIETNQKSIFPLTQQIIDILMIYAVLSWECSHFFRRFFWSESEKQNPQTLSFFGCMRQPIQKMTKAWMICGKKLQIFTLGQISLGLTAWCLPKCPLDWWTLLHPQFHKCVGVNFQFFPSLLIESRIFIEFHNLVWMFWILVYCIYLVMNDWKN